MTDRASKTTADDPMHALELAALRNIPLSVGRPDQIGIEPLARGRFLPPEDGVIAVEELQIPGRRVYLEQGSKVEAYFLLDGQIYQFRSTVLDMDAPVRLNDRMTVRGLRLAAPKTVDKGNRRQIYRQSFASAPAPVDVQIWAIPESALSPEQRARLAPDPTEDDADPGAWSAPGSSLRAQVSDLTLGQLGAVMEAPASWQGEVADASEFGLGLTVFNVVYSRFKVFQPIAVRFRLPGVTMPLEFLIEVRRVQALKQTDARLGGLLLINNANPAEVRSARELSQFSLMLQRARAKRAG